MTLTQKFIDRLQATGVAQRHPDDKVRGLILRVSPKGTKSYFAVYRDANRKLREVKLGSATVITLASARKEATSALAKVSVGEDPRAEKFKEQEKRRRELSTQTETVAQLYRQWKKTAHWKGLREATQKNYENSFEKHILPEIGRLPIASLTRRRISELLDKLLLEKSDYTSIHAKVALGVFGNYLLEMELWEFNIAHTVRQKGKRRVRKRVLSDDELRAFWAYLETHEELSHTVRDMLKIVLFAPARINEIAKARVEWFDPVRRSLIIPAEVMKKDREFEYPLTDTAYEIIEARIANGQVVDGWLFPNLAGDSNMDGKRAGRTCQRIAERCSFSESFGPHDLRRTFATKMAEAGHDDRMIERCLSHEVDSGKAIINYNHAKYRSQKLEVLSAWEKEFRMIVSNADRL